MEEQQEKKTFFLKRIYIKQYKKLLIIPVLLLVLALVQIGVQTATTGDFINKGVSLKGGITVTVEKSTDIIELQRFLDDQFPKADISVRSISQTGKQVGTIVEASDADADELVGVLEESLNIEKGEYSVEVMGSSLGDSFFKETFRALVIAFLLMGIVVFVYFRVLVPSFAVILSAFSDIVITLAIVNVIGMKLSTAGIAAFLMLIGYSVDTDILLCTKVIKRKNGTPIERVFGAMKTGLTMSVTTMTALFVALIFAQSIVLKQIMTILLIGLAVDLINTWIQNAGILRWYVEKKERRNE